MEKIIFNNQILQYISLFSHVTKITSRDCIDLNSKIVFIVEEGQAGIAIGKKGMNVKLIEKKLNKKIKIIEFSNDSLQFIKNIVYPNKLKDIVCKDSVYTMTAVDSMTRGMLIGRNAQNLREFESIAQRYYDVKELKVI